MVNGQNGFGVVGGHKCKKLIKRGYIEDLIIPFLDLKTRQDALEIGLSSDMNQIFGYKVFAPRSGLTVSNPFFF